MKKKITSYIPLQSDIVKCIITVDLIILNFNNTLIIKDLSMGMGSLI